MPTFEALQTDAITLRERKAKVDAELASLKPKRKRAKKAPIPPGGFLRGISITVEAASVMYGPLMESGLYYRGGRCPTCGHRLST